MKSASQWRQELALAPVRNIDVDWSKGTWNRNWFRHRNQITFSTYLTPRFNGESPIKLLQIGVFEGMDLFWQMHTTCIHQDSVALGVDPWLGMKKLNQVFMSQAKENAHSNLGPWIESGKIALVQGTSQEILPTLHDRFDLIIVDGCHSADSVYTDAVNCLGLSNPGTWIVFDDVVNRIKKENHVEHGLRRFLDDHEGRMDLVWKHNACECYQVV